MRPIKFRAWYESEGTMVYEPPVTAYPEASINDLLKTSLCTLMQYTGLLDRNGVEIYEGDLVRIGSYTDPLEIVFSNKGRWIAKRKGMIDFPHDIKPIAIEVIGNIHENPELLGVGEVGDTPTSEKSNHHQGQERMISQ